LRLADRIAIRPAGPEEIEAVAALHAEAFAASPHGHHGEAELVRTLVTDGDALVALGAWVGTKLVGHVLFSRMAVAADGLALPAAALAPVAVLPAHRRQGIAANLICAGHERLAALGVRMVFVLGDPAYYRRFGYDAALARPFASPYAGPFFMALGLDSALPRPQRGEARHPPAFSRLA